LTPFESVARHTANPNRPASPNPIHLVLQEDKIKEVAYKNVVCGIRITSVHNKKQDYIHQLTPSPPASLLPIITGRHRNASGVASTGVYKKPPPPRAGQRDQAGGSPRWLPPALSSPPPPRMSSEESSRILHIHRGLQTPYQERDNSGLISVYNVKPSILS
jgi:hypothetical protein